MDTYIVKVYDGSHENTHSDWLHESGIKHFNRYLCTWGDLDCDPRADYIYEFEDEADALAFKLLFGGPREPRTK